MLSRGSIEVQLPLFIKLLQPQPILLVDRPLVQRRHLTTSDINLREQGTLLRNSHSILLKHEHGKPIQRRQILFIRLILNRALVVDIRQEIAVLQVRFQLFRVTEVLRRHDARLRKARPPSRSQELLGSLAEPVVPGARLKRRDAVVLTTECDEVVDGWAVAALDVPAKELATLREA